MHHPLKIGLTMRCVISAGHGELRDCISHDWITLLDAWGDHYVFLSNASRELDSIISNLDMVILTGGDDVKIFQGDSQKKAEIKTESIRDYQECHILNRCIQRDIPVIGVCRGMQLLNYRFGGTVLATNDGKHLRKKHNVEFIIPSIFPNLEKIIAINSYHNNVIPRARLATDLEVFATSEDGLVEACYHKHHRIAGIMWHPERADGRPDVFRRIVLRLLHNWGFELCE